MAFIVGDACVKCKLTDCVEVCPVEAFHEGPNMLYINPETCIDCNACVEECPVEAIFADVDVPDKWEKYTDMNEQMCNEYPVIIEKMDPLPSAKTLEEMASFQIHNLLPSPLQSTLALNLWNHCSYKF